MVSYNTHMKLTNQLLDAKVQLKESVVSLKIIDRLDLCGLTL
jgi:hypothetical protein